MMRATLISNKKCLLQRICLLHCETMAIADNPFKTNWSHLVAASQWSTLCPPLPHGDDHVLLQALEEKTMSPMVGSGRS